MKCVTAHSLSSQTGSNKLASDLGLLLIFPNFWHVHIASSESAWLYNYYFICLSSMPPCFHGAYWPLWSHTTQSLSKAVIAQWVFFQLTFSICWNGFFFILRPKSNAVSRSHSHLHDIGVSHAVFYLTHHLPVNHFSKDLWSKKLIKKKIEFLMFHFFQGMGLALLRHKAFHCGQHQSCAAASTLNVIHALCDLLYPPF